MTHLTKIALSYFVFLICGGLSANAQSSQFSIEDILNASFPTHLTAASHGDQVAWVFNNAGERNIWLYDAASDGSKPLTTYVGDDGQAISNLTFTQDGAHIIFVRGGARNRQGENPNPTSDPDGASRAIYSVSTAGGEVRKLADGSQPALSPDGTTLAFASGGQVWTISIGNDDNVPTRLFKIRGGAGSLQWNPNSQTPKLAFVSNRGDHSFVGIYDFASDVIKYIDPSVDNDASPHWSPDGTQMAFMRTPSVRSRLPFYEQREGHPWSIHTVSADGSNHQQIWKADSGDGSVFRFISGASQIYWTARDRIVFPWEKDGWTHLYSIDVNGRDLELLSPGDGEVQYVTVGSNKEHIYFSANIGDINRQHIWRTMPGSPTSLVQLTEGSGVEWAPVNTGGTVYCLASSGTTPAAPMRLDQNNVMSHIAPQGIPDAFPSGQISPPEEITFTATDGMTIHGQLFKPKNYQSEQEYPAVLFFHGGSRRQMLMGFHHSGYYHNAFALNQFLANQGYLVLAVNYRSGIGYGMEFREALNYGANGASEFQDVIGAGLYMKSRSDVDGNNIGLWGGSYGGYLTALGLARASDLFAAGVDIHGVHDWNVVIKNFVPSYNANTDRERARRAYESSPMAHLDGWRSPVLLIHGDDDRNVPFSETVEIAESLRDRDVYFEQLIFPDEVHGFLLHRNWLAAYKATFDFFEQFLKD